VVIVKMVLKEAVVRPIVLVIQTLAQKDEWRFKKGDSEK
jgi:hypothetical protein